MLELKINWIVNKYKAFEMIIPQEMMNEMAKRIAYEK